MALLPSLSLAALLTFIPPADTKTCLRFASVSTDSVESVGMCWLCLARSCPSPLGVLTRHLILHFLTSYTNSLVLKAILEHPNKDVKVIAINDPFIEVAYGVRKFFHLASVSQLPWET
jgi:hypothetical protein